MLISAFLFVLKSAAIAAGLVLAGRVTLWLVFRRAPDVPASLVAGALVLYVAMLALRKIAWAVALLVVLALAELARSLRLRSPPAAANNHRWEWALAGLLVVTTVVNPVTEWIRAPSGSFTAR